MTLKAIIPSGQTEITVNGLHQWDYGRELEIHSAELPALVEVHFACAGMKEAVVRVCEAVDGVATAVIPDRCLEQTTPITAWVYVVNDTEGLTTKTITLPIIPRTKPQPGESIPEEYTDQYTELITAVNDAIASLADGSVKAGYAHEAGHATSADSATTASTAVTANHATTATTLKRTKLVAGEWSVGDVISAENILKPYTRYLVNIDNLFYEAVTGEVASAISFGDTVGNTAGAIITGAAIKYDEDEEGLIFQYYNRLILRKDGGVVDVVASTSYDYKLYEIYELDTLPVKEV